MKRVLSLAIALVMILSMMPNVFAVESNEDQLPSDAGTLGTEANPQVLTELGYVDLTLAAGDADGYYYSYTAEGDGTVTVYISSIAAAATDDNELPLTPASVSEETVTGDIVLTNKTTGVVKTLSEDGVDNYGLELTVEVAAGDVILIQVTASAAAELTWYANFAYPQGTEQNPIYPEWTWNEEWTEATATVTAPVGTTYYAANANGMILTINGEEYGVLTAAGMGYPAIFTIINSGEAAAEYSLKIAYPLGHQMNPEVITYLEGQVSLEEGDYDGYYYKYIAEGTGSITLYITSITEGVEGDIVLSNNNTYAQRSLSADGVDNYGLEVTMDVNEGDEIIIQVLAQMDAEWNYPAAEISWMGSFTYPQGSEQSPIEIYSNQLDANNNYTVTVPAGKTYYFTACFLGGMDMSINGGEPVTVAGMFYNFTITNNGDADAEYVINFQYPLGHQMNPEVITELKDEVSLEEGDFDGYYYKYIAEETGTITLYITSITEGVAGDIILTNNNTYAQKSLSGDGVDGKVTLEVNAGDEIIIQVQAQMDAEYNYPATEISWEGSAEAAPDEEVVLGDANGDGVLDARDVIRLKRYLAGIEGIEIDEASADVTGDGIVDARDAIRLERYLAGIEGVELG